MIFEEAFFSRLNLLTDQISLPDCIYLLRYCTMCIVVICCPVCDVINFEINHNFLTVFVRNQTFKTKMKISQEQKELLT